MAIVLAILTLAVLALAALLVAQQRGGPKADPAEEARRLTSEAVERLMQEHRELREADRETREAERRSAEASLKQREAEMRRLTQPMTKNLERIEREITDLGKSRQAADGATKTLLEQMSKGLGELSTQTGALVTALRKPHVRGRWGEVQLRRCVEIACMTEHVDFELQETLKTDQVWLRPDARFMLPGGRSVVADSKVPLDAYIQALEAEEEGGRAAQLQRHASQAREHVRSLGSKRYQDQFRSGDTPDFVICFFPSEPALHAAFEADPALYEEAFEHGVLIATPTTLIGLLRTIELGWRQERIAEEAQQIAETARELHARFGKFLGDIDKVGKRLSSATGAYNEAVGSLERRVLPQLRRIEDLGAGSGKERPEPQPIDQEARGIVAGELEALETEDRIGPRVGLPPADSEAA